MRFVLTIVFNSLALLLCLVCLFCAITEENVAVLIMEIIFIILNAFCIIVNVRFHRRNKCSKKKNQN